MPHLFAYGTLMCEDIMCQVSGHRSAPTPAILRGYRRYRIKGEPYPALVAAQHGCVQGVVYRDIPLQAWSRLDRFEGEMYARHAVRPELNESPGLVAQTYLLRPEFSDCLEPCEWDFATFLRQGKAAFIRSYKGYQAL